MCLKSLDWCRLFLFYYLLQVNDKVTIKAQLDWSFVLEIMAGLLQWESMSIFR